MADLIDRVTLLDAMPKNDMLLSFDVRRIIVEQQTVDAVPVVHARWIHDINNLYGCSSCLRRETMSHKKIKNYCPNCGACMDEKEES